jgi:hypothetical protein
MSDELDVFGGEASEPKRKLKTGGPIWGPLERLLPWVVLVSCHSRASYARTIVWMCEVLRRVPRSRDNGLENESATIIEQQTVTRAMGERNENAPLARKLLNGYRTGMPLTWTERNEFLTSYTENKNKQPRIAVGEMAALLGRNDSDCLMIAKFIIELLDGKRFPDEDAPVERNDEELRKWATRAVISSAPSTWAALKAVSLGLPVPTVPPKCDIDLSELE